MYDFIDSKILNHNCHYYDLTIKNCEVCDIKTCNWTMVAKIYSLNYVVYIDCSNKVSNINNINMNYKSNLYEKWNKVISDNKEKHKIELFRLNK